MSTNEEIIRNLYHAAEVKDVPAFIDLFTADGYFYDVSAGKKYYGKDIGKTVDIYALAFPDMHRELFNLYSVGDVVVVELSLNGTHNGPLELPAGTIPPTGKEIHAPCCDVFHIESGKVKSFHCYTAATILLGQLGVLANLGGSFSK
ncbi:MAG TPA: nuclear transport factor 2 family protein [Rhizomicrobium sp.]|jgi:ketosteroid isomerase-like protein|nr:nuclear transport factor 2 family protein [Rhizomicrobium sp.]